MGQEVAGLVEFICNPKRRENYSLQESVAEYCKMYKLLIVTVGLLALFALGWYHKVQLYILPMYCTFYIC